MDAPLAWANDTYSKTVPKSALGKALHYLLKQWPYLVRYLEDGRLELSNNRAERSIKPFAMGRKNWLFANTPAGAQYSAVIYILIETAAVLRVIADNPKITQKDLAAAIGKSERTVKTRMMELQTKGYLRRENGKRNGRWELLVTL